MMRRVSFPLRKRWCFRPTVELLEAINPPTALAAGEALPHSTEAAPPPLICPA
jgi:hypothetical protein